MITKGIVSAVVGEKYRLNIDGNQTAAISTMCHVGHFTVDFENRVFKKEPIKVGDNVVAYFDDGGYYNGYILGLLGE